MSRNKLFKFENYTTKDFISNVLNNAPYPIIIVNLDLSINYVNISFEELTGFSTDEIIGRKTPYPWWPEQRISTILLELQKAFNIGVFKHEKLFQKKNGELFWVEITSNPIMTNGEVCYLLSNWVEITKCEQTENELKYINSESEESLKKLNLEMEAKIIDRTKDLQKSEEKYRELFNGMSSGVAVYDVIGKGENFIFKDINKTGEKISNVRKEEIIGKNVVEIFPGIIDSGLLNTFKKVYLSNKSMRHPITLYSDKRLTHWMGNYVYKLPTGEVISVYDDLTQIKVMEEKLIALNEILEQKVRERTKELKEKEKFLSDTFSSIQDGICAINTNDEIFKANSGMENMFKEHSPTIGKKCYEIFHNKTEKCEPCTCNNVIYKGEACYNTIKRRDSNKKIIGIYNTSCFPLTDQETGKIIGKIEYIKDNTEKYYAEQKLKKYQNKLEKLNAELEERVKERTKEALFKEDVIESTSNVIATANLDGLMTYVNPAFLKIWGYEDTKLIYGRHFKEFWMIEEQIDEILTILFKGGSWSDEIKAKKNNGDLFDVQVSTNIVFDKKGNPISLMSSSIDISARKKSEEKLKEYQRRLKKLNEDLEVKVIQRTKKLKEETEKAESYLNIVDVIIVALDRAGNISLLNKKGYETLEYNKGELIGKNWFLICLSQQDRIRVKNDYENLINGDIEVIPDYENLIHTKSGDERLIAWSTFILRDDKGVFIGVLNSGKDITEKRKAELKIRGAQQKLEESEEKFRNIAEQSLMGIAIAQENSIKYMNNTYSEIFGYTIQEMKQWTLENLKDVIHPDDLDFCLTQLKKKQIGTADIIKNYEYRAFKKNGEIIWVENYSKPIIYKNKPSDFITVIDITKRKEAEQQLKESEEKFRTISDQSLVGIVIAQDGIIKYNNKQMEFLSGYTMEEMKSWKAGDFLKIIHPDYKELIAVQSKKKQKGLDDVIDQYEFLGIKKSGQHIWVDDYSRTITYEGKLAVLSILVDITEKKKAEQKLKESEEKYRELVDNANSIILKLDKEAKITFINEFGEKFFGYSQEELIGNSVLGTIVPKTETSGRDLEKMINEIFQHPERFERNENENITKDGEKIWISWANKPIMDENGVLNGILGVGTDITNKKKIESLIKKENKKLNEINQIRKDLITRVSHELNTPLISIYSASELLLNYLDEQMPEKVYTFIKIINEGGKRMKHLVDELLYVSRLEAKKLVLTKKQENIVKIIKNCLHELNPYAVKRKIFLTPYLPKKLFLEVDKEKFRVIVTNILSNAIKNSHPMGKVTLSLVDNDEFVDLIIKDKGIGLTNEEKHKLFNKFGKIERFGQGMDIDIEGSGLGLYITQELVNLHEGQIFMESEGRNQGATFTIRINKSRLLHENVY